MPQLATDIDGVVRAGRILIADDAPQSSSALDRVPEQTGVRVIRPRSECPTGNAYAERSVRSMKEKSLDRIVPLGERLPRRALMGCGARHSHSHVGNRQQRHVDNRQRLGGTLSY
jgi:hypothetical protein